MILVSGNEYLIYWIGAAVCVVGGILYTAATLLYRWFKR